MSIGPIQSNSIGSTPSQQFIHGIAGSPSALPAELAADQRNLVRAVKGLDASKLFGENSELTFVIDRDTHKALVRVVDRDTKEVLMQLPPEYVVKMAREQQQGHSEIKD